MFKRNKILFILFIILVLLIPTKFTRADIADDLQGYILLQVEAHGEAWYVFPKDNKRYFLGKPNDAFAVMRQKGLGISHKQLTQYLSSYFPLRLAGMILLDVEKKGEAYYVFPGDLQGYYLGRPADAYKIMRKKGLGITNKNLSYISSDSSWAVYTEKKIGTGEIVDTGQGNCYSDSTEINCRAKGKIFYGQDTQYQGQSASYLDNDDDGTVTDKNTGLMWKKTYENKTDFYTAKANASALDFSDYKDWRLPTIKELYSLIDFSGHDISGETSTDNSKPFINTKYFNFAYGDDIAGESLADSKWISSDIYKSKIAGDKECFFGVNFADGSLGCYETKPNGRIGNNGYYVRYVRSYSYGTNVFSNNKDGTVSDLNSKLMWSQADSGEGLDWAGALKYCEDLKLAGYDDWRLPNIKELQSIVDYGHSFDATNTPAIDPVFKISQIKNEAGEIDYPYFWSSTTHIDTANNGNNAAYIAFGRGMGYIEALGGWVDTRGTGAQGFDPKSKTSETYPVGRGLLGDAIRIDNYVRCVRGEATFVNVAPTVSEPEPEVEVIVPPVVIPPTEDEKACFDKKENQGCEFKASYGNVVGTCLMNKEKLICIQ